MNFFIYEYKYMKIAQYMLVFTKILKPYFTQMIWYEMI